MKTFDWRFKTFNDPILTDFLNTVKQQLITTRTEQSIFTVSGPTETGKTYLLDRVGDFYDAYNHLYYFKYERFDSRLLVNRTWESIVQKLFDEPGYIDVLGSARVLIIEDFLCENYTKVNSFNSIAIDLAYKVINRRVRKCTWIDTNKSFEEIEILDKRIASRIITRDGAKAFVLPSNTQIYSHRKPCST